MAKKFFLNCGQLCPLRHANKPTSQQANKKAKAMLLEIPLNELRQARGLSQKMLAEVLTV